MTYLRLVETPTNKVASVLKSPADRARDAHVDIYKYLHGNNYDLEEIVHKLESVFSTAEAALHPGSPPQKSPVSFSKGRHAVYFEKVKVQLFKEIDSGTIPNVIYSAVIGVHLKALGFKHYDRDDIRRIMHNRAN